MDNLTIQLGVQGQDAQIASPAAGTDTSGVVFAEVLLGALSGQVTGQAPALVLSAMLQQSGAGARPRVAGESEQPEAPDLSVSDSRTSGGSKARLASVLSDVREVPACLRGLVPMAPPLAVSQPEALVAFQPVPSVSMPQLAQEAIQRVSPATGGPAPVESWVAAADPILPTVRSTAALIVMPVPALAQPAAREPAAADVTSPATWPTAQAAAQLAPVPSDTAAPVVATVMPTPAYQPAIHTDVVLTAVLRAAAPREVEQIVDARTSVTPARTAPASQASGAPTEAEPLQAAAELANGATSAPSDGASPKLPTEASRAAAGAAPGPVTVVSATPAPAEPARFATGFAGTSGAAPQTAAESSAVTVGTPRIAVPAPLLPEDEVGFGQRPQATSDRPADVEARLTTPDARQAPPAADPAIIGSQNAAALDGGIARADDRGLNTANRGASRPASVSRSDLSDLVARSAQPITEESSPAGVPTTEGADAPAPRPAAFAARTDTALASAVRDSGVIEDPATLTPQPSSKPSAEPQPSASAQVAPASAPIGTTGDVQREAEARPSPAPRIDESGGWASASAQAGDDLPAAPQVVARQPDATLSAPADAKASTSARNDTLRTTPHVITRAASAPDVTTPRPAQADPDPGRAAALQTEARQNQPMPSDPAAVPVRRPQVAQVGAPVETVEPPVPEVMKPAATQPAATGTPIGAATDQSQATEPTRGDLQTYRVQRTVTPVMQPASTPVAAPLREAAQSEAQSVAPAANPGSQASASAVPAPSQEAPVNVSADPMIEAAPAAAQSGDQRRVRGIPNAAEAQSSPQPLLTGRRNEPSATQTLAAGGQPADPQPSDAPVAPDKAQPGEAPGKKQESAQVSQPTSQTESQKLIPEAHAASENARPDAGPIAVNTAGSHAPREAAHPSPSPAPSAPHIVEQIARAARGQMAGEHAELTLRLDPPTLGTVHMRVVSEGAALTAHLQVSTQASRELISDNLPALKQALAGAGIDIGQLSVSVDSGAHQQLPQGLPLQPQWQQQQQTAASRVQAAQNEPALAALRAWGNAGGSHFDAFA